MFFPKIYILHCLVSYIFSETHDDFSSYCQQCEYSNDSYQVYDFFQELQQMIMSRDKIN